MDTSATILEFTRLKQADKMEMNIYGKRCTEVINDHVYLSSQKFRSAHTVAELCYSNLMMQCSMVRAFQHLTGTLSFLNVFDVING